MKFRNILIILLLSNITIAMASEFKMQIVLKDNITTQDRNFFGVDYRATNYLDSAKEIGEFELPTLALPEAILIGAFQVQKEIKNQSGMSTFEDVYSYKDYRSEFRGANDSLVYIFKIVHPASDFKLMFNGTFPANVKSAKVYSVTYPYDTYDLKNNNIVSIKYNKALLSYVYRIVLKNYDDDTRVENINERIEVYPNPTSDKVYFSERVLGNVILHSIDGKEYVKMIEDNIISIDDIPNGTYIITAKDLENKVIRKKIVKN